MNLRKIFYIIDIESEEMKNDAYGYTRADFENYLISVDEKPTKAKIIIERLYREKISDFAEMTDINAKTIEKLSRDFYFGKLKILDKKEDETVAKFLFELADGNKIETVVMKHDYGNGLCISTQVGCNMGCKFCESGKLKKVRNLTSAEMVQQVTTALSQIQNGISHIVVMGIGEPFDNYDNLIRFIDIVTDQRGLDIGSRHITVSTCGIVPKIEEYLARDNQNNLAISLHSADSDTRSMIMPINKAYDMSEIIEVIRKSDNIRKKITFEYIMLDGINDSDDDALKLCDLLKGINCYVNLIPYNETSNSVYKASSKDRIAAFYDILKKHKTKVTIRREFGASINAACGQLRSKWEE